MQREEIIKAIANKFNIKEENIKNESRFIEDLNLDSIDLVETIMDIEEDYNISIPDEKAITIKKVEDFINVINESEYE